ncbi:hypothetical protein [Psychroserpens sp.]
MATLMCLTGNVLATLLIKNRIIVLQQLLNASSTAEQRHTFE